MYVLKSTNNFIIANNTKLFFKNNFLKETESIFNLSDFIGEDYNYNGFSYILLKLNELDNFYFLKNFEKNYHKLNNEIIFLNMIYIPNSNILISTYYNRTSVVLQFFELVPYDYWNLERLSQVGTPTRPNQKIFLDKTGIFIQDFNINRFDKFIEKKDYVEINNTINKETNKFLFFNIYLTFSALLHVFIFTK